MDSPTADQIVVDASAVVELLLQGELSDAVQSSIGSSRLHAPAHVDAEVLSAFGRLQRGKRISERDVSARLRHFLDLPLERHGLTELLLGAWRRRRNLRLADALYVELAVQLGMRLVTIDSRLARATTVAKLVTA